MTSLSLVAQADMMVCISTSNTLRENVLRHAGAKTTAEFKKNYNPQEVLVLDGGSTAAQKIMFVPWQTEIEETDVTRIQKVRRSVLSSSRTCDSPVVSVGASEVVSRRSAREGDQNDFNPTGRLLPRDDRAIGSSCVNQIGTGQLELDSWVVCEALIGAARECLHQYSMNVKFVIYSFSSDDNANECYQVRFLLHSNVRRTRCA